MITRPLLAVLAAGTVILAACGGDGSSSQAVCPTFCTAGCDTSGNCLDSATITQCPAADKPVGVSVAAAGTVQSLGHHTVGETVHFEVPAGTASITIIEQAVQAPDFITFRGTLANTAVPNVVKDPSDKVIYDDSARVPSDPTAIEGLSAFFASTSPATGTLTIPNTTGGLSLAASGLATGSWSLVVSDYAWECAATTNCTGGSRTSVYDVTVITKPLAGGAIPSGGTLDVVIWFVADEVDGVALSATAAAAGSDPDVKRLEDSLRAILGSADIGVTLGTVTYNAVSAALQAQYASGVDVDSSGACAPLAQLLKNNTNGDALNVFLVPGFTSTSFPPGSEVVGFDGTIPGPATVAGTVASGVAVSVADLRFRPSACVSGTVAFAPGGAQCGADETAYIIAHEAGHFLGLYHTNESGGSSFDPLADTGRCPCTTCAPTTSRASCNAATNPYSISVSDCNGAVSGCGGGDNLMFWQLDAGSQATLSAQQREVIHANPLLR